RTPRRLRLPRLQPHLLATPRETPIMIVLRALKIDIKRIDRISERVAFTAPESDITPTQG
ncbi:hypothetical protein, partial [Streptomyces sp. NPDC005533]|uniref:hypothetical protein n=1 Tax=Streptomyces sp. NPDC005533 TaxID=3364723 RepID=UPI00369D8E4C